jgi:hypothetical protein
VCRGYMHVVRAVQAITCRVFSLVRTVVSEICMHGATRHDTLRTHGDDAAAYSPSERCRAR